jgi:PhzF family phenazine biosynthesis protein
VPSCAPFADDEGRVGKQVRTEYESVSRNKMKEFWQIDAFTTRPFCGNPAAIVFDCDDMSPEWMQAVSREMNLSETVFFLRPTKAGADYRVRFFTPRRELPFAGHPTVAAAHAFFEKCRAERGAEITLIRQECEAGVIPIKVRKEGNSRVYVMQQRTPEHRTLTKPTKYYAQILGCDPWALGDRPVQVVSTGIPWMIVQLANERALEDLAPRFLEIEQECRKEQAVGLTAFALDGGDSSWIANVRTFAPGEGVMEDPACGSGNGAVGAYLARNLFPDRVGFRYEAFQGQKVNRPARILVECAREIDGEVRVNVGGTAIKVLEGKILPEIYGL